MFVETLLEPVDSLSALNDATVELLYRCVHARVSLMCVPIHDHVTPLYVLISICVSRFMGQNWSSGSHFRHIKQNDGEDDEDSDERRKTDNGNSTQQQ